MREAYCPHCGERVDYLINRLKKGILEELKKGDKISIMDLKRRLNFTVAYKNLWNAVYKLEEYGYLKLIKSKNEVGNITYVELVKDKNTRF